MKKRVSIFKSFLYTLLIYIVFSVIGGFLGQIVFKMNDYTILQGSIVGIALLVFMGYFYKVELFGKKNLKLGFSGIGVGLIVALLLNHDVGYLSQNIPHLGMIIISCLRTGISEETIFRVVAIFLIGNIFYYSKNRLYLEIYLSSIVFALAHLLNIISNNQAFDQTVIQVIYAFCLGTIFAIIYLATKNILYAMVLHFLVDLLGGLFSASNLTSVSIDFLNMFLLVMVVLIAAAFNWLVLKNKYNGTFGN
ncbi:CPBP family intramembrane glutamic endopeptidase [Companilactobacillus kimchiensis]|uniref:CAAX prenyl protease 2/Lysostaphin resistance protein A-like domain-containing protein n=1 Tax=Companilactobacillus kimchiensis TaxID=993692 RepID=A0A0R2L7Q0_9LACO|nr:CPBP family intramembrane glutamic endopeptidase [Companilactobacillus kimchiensis]KRN97887.1 hypothetical protein IV57_GL001560 [Companilactobacillus kimchiensis]